MALIPSGPLLGAGPPDDICVMISNEGCPAPVPPSPVLVGQVTASGLQACAAAAIDFATSSADIAVKPFR